MDLHLGFLASRRGTNVRAILEAIARGDLVARPRVLISNNPEAEVLHLAQERGIPRYCVNARSHADVDGTIVGILREHDVNLVVLAGYMKRIGQKTLDAYQYRILNIHPALLPDYGGKGMHGLAVHKAVIDAGDKESGATVHMVTNEYDAGRILAQDRVPRFATDTPETLSERVLQVEHVLYSRVLADIQRGIVRLDP
jgi:phosphoribosylglycinamide formyltransferase-1